MQANRDSGRVQERSWCRAMMTMMIDAINDNDDEIKIRLSYHEVRPSAIAAHLGYIHYCFNDKTHNFSFILCLASTLLLLLRAPKTETFGNTADPTLV